ncbi:hypothetical protein AMATHDRAFT_69125 [Amanita thiersii Skay4041]|uniref:Carboxypeptidase n=1 Tax=Amanita thiersii Skay4041 TaxID=703135 RepID=A0A2A9NGB8_9AGAR|nr:hypothetical protein AMATHDRAFT_69125 [Amanita thiersii Skay4041]
MMLLRCIQFLVCCAILCPHVLVSGLRDTPHSMQDTIVKRRNLVTQGALTYVKDSGICETTPGVHQVSGYVEVSAASRLWFWFFEARKNPEDAPLTIWLNGGPGCSSMIGLFTENGPCQVNQDNSTTSINQFSWNNVSNMLYFDQPFGSGFSYGIDATTTSNEAAAYFWTAFQMLLQSAEFMQFQSRSLILATESYGGHFGPVFVNYFTEQSGRIRNGELEGIPVKFSGMLINNGRHDPLIQSQSYIEFVTNAPGYGPLQNDSTIAAMSAEFDSPDGCKHQLEICYASGSDQQCSDAYKFCQRTVYEPAVNGYDDSSFTNDPSVPFPPLNYLSYLRSQDVMTSIGASSLFDQCSTLVQNDFSLAGELGRTFLPELGKLADAGFRLLIWAGDTDIKCNWLGVHESMVAMNWHGNETLKSMDFMEMSIDGKPIAAVKNIGNFSFARVYRAGHHLPGYQPEAALEIFAQFLQQQPLHSVEGAAVPSPSATPPSAGSSGSRVMMPVKWSRLVWIWMMFVLW